MQNRPLLVGIVGISGSGKTSIANSIVKKLQEQKQDVTYIRADHYYKSTSHLSPEELAKYNFEVPEAVDMNGLHHDLQELLNGKPIQRRIHKYAISSEDGVDPTIFSSKLILVEGMFLLADERIRKLFSILFLVDTPMDIALARRAARDLQTLGDCNKVVNDYESQFRPAAISNVYNFKQHTQINLNNNTREEQKESVEQAVKIINNKLQSKIKPPSLLTTALRFSPMLVGLGLFASKLLSTASKDVSKTVHLSVP